MAVMVVPTVTPVPLMTEPTASVPDEATVIVSVVVEMDPVPEKPTTTLLIRAEVPVTVRLLPTVIPPAESLTMLLIVPEGWMTLMVLRVLMAASY
jgi:hypothetical protein